MALHAAVILAMVGGMLCEVVNKLTASHHGAAGLRPFRVIMSAVKMVEVSGVLRYLYAWRRTEA